MLDQIVAQLERNEGVHDWTLRRRAARSVQLYLIGQEIENVREVETEEYDLEVYNDHPFPAGFKDHGGEAPAGNARMLPKSRSATGMVPKVTVRLNTPA